MPSSQAHLHTVRAQAAGHRPARVAAADDKRTDGGMAGPGKAAGKADGHRAQGAVAAGDVRRIADPPARGNGIANQSLKNGPARAPLTAELAGAAQLAENLELAGNGRLESGRHSHEMSGGRPAGAAVHLMCLQRTRELFELVSQRRLPEFGDGSNGV